jgi:LmbE family N-acetylglucosaminyl deacetylase
MVERLMELIELYRPTVVVTYPSNGLSGHPDHIRTHTLVRTALRAVPQPPLLYYIALSRSRLLAAQNRVRAALGPDAWIPPEEMSIDDCEITTVIDITAHWRDKLRALSSHASQSDAAALLTMFGAAEGNGPGVYVEEYIAADARPGGQAVEPGFGGIAPTALAGRVLSAAGTIRSEVER